MTREQLDRAARAVERAGEATADADRSERLADLADRLRSQSERDATPALGVLDRIQYSLDEVADETDDGAVAEDLEDAREHVFAFLGTLDDRGMTQHGLPTDPETNDG